MTTYLIMFYLYDVDVIRIMDWLSEHYASLNYLNKKVVFERPGFLVVVFFGDI